MTVLPSSLALTTIADGSNIVAADHRNNYTAVQTATNALIAALGAGAAGQVLGGSGSTVAWQYPPGYELAYQVYSTDQTTASTSFADLFSFAAATFENVKCYLEVAVPSLTATIANDTVEFRLVEGSTQVGDVVSFDTHSSVGNSVCASARIPFTPTAGPHTYKVQWLTAFAATAKIKASVGDATFRIVKA